MVTKTKQERKIEIHKLEKKAIKLFKLTNSKEENERINKMLEKVIRLEDKYEKEFGINPSIQKYGKQPKKRKGRKKQTTTLQEDMRWM